MKYFRFTRGRRLQPSVSMAVGFLFTIGLPILVLLGFIYQRAGSQTAVNFLLTGLLLLLFVFPFVERMAIMGGEGNAFFEFAKQGNPGWVVYTVGWLLLGGYFSLAGAFAWGAAIYAANLLQPFVDIQVPPNLLAVLFLLLFVIINRGKGSRLLLRQQALFVYVAIGLLILIMLWAVRQMPENFTVLAGSSATRLNLGTAPMLSLAFWGVIVLFDRMDARRSPRLVLNTAVAALLIGMGLGVAAVSMMAFFPAAIRSSLTPWLVVAFQVRFITGVIFALLAIVTSFLGMRLTLTAGVHTLSAMIDSEFFPQRESFTFRNVTISHVPIVLIIGFIAVLLAFFPQSYLLGIGVVALFGSILLVLAPDTFRSKPNLPEERPLKLPLHPLFPAAVSLGCILLISLIPWNAWIGIAIWGGVGLVLYFRYVRSQQIEVVQRDVLLSNEDVSLADVAKMYTVLVPVVDEQTSLPVIQAAMRIAEMHLGRVLLLRILDAGDVDAPLRARNAGAEHVLAQMNMFLAGLGDTAVPIVPLVRLDHEFVQGIYDTVWEEKVDFLLITTQPFEGKETEEYNLIDRVLRQVSTEVGIFKGEIPEEITTVLVPVQGSMHTVAALALAQDLVQRTQGRVIALYQTADELTEARQQAGQQYIDRILRHIDNDRLIQTKIIQSPNFENSILDEAENADLVLFGLATEGYFQQTTFDGRPANIAAARSGPTLLVKRKESTLRHAWNRLIFLLLNWVPDSTIKERAEVTLQMQQDAKAGPDFYILIILAASIAFFGLLQNSAAVIIGAMLVAPLMSPMMAMAHGLILANFKMIQEAANSTLRGILAAIGIGTIFVIVLPPQPVTSEILARTQPNYLDLLVALVSGAAGAYAASRKNLSAALPGVAIAAALVPPLCVVGYGLGTGRVDIASGSLLLFLTNLASIVLASAMVFLLLGFQPRRDDRYVQVRRNIVRVVLALLVISIPLLFASATSARQNKTELTVETIVRDAVSASEGEVQNIEIQSLRSQGIVVTVTIYAYKDYAPEAIYALQQDLTEAIGEPITLRVSIVKATLTIVDEAGFPTPTPAPISSPVSEDTAVSTPTILPTATHTPKPTLTPTP